MSQLFPLPSLHSILPNNMPGTHQQLIRVCWVNKKSDVINEEKITSDLSLCSWGLLLEACNKWDLTLERRKEGGRHGYGQGSDQEAEQILLLALHSGRWASMFFWIFYFFSLDTCPSIRELCPCYIRPWKKSDFAFVLS